MKTLSIVLICTVWLISHGLAAAHEDDEKPFVRAIHLKDYENYIITTTDDRIKIWTKEDPFDGKLVGNIEGYLLIAPKLAQKEGGWADLCVYKDSSTKNKDLILQVSIRDEGKWHGAQAKGFHFYHFTISKDLFSRAIFGIGNDEEVIKILCHKAENPSKRENADKTASQNETGAQGGANQHATAPESKPEGRKKANPESEERSEADGRPFPHTH